MINCRLCGVAARRVLRRNDVALYGCPACGLVSGTPTVEATPEDRYRDYYRRPEPAAPVARYAEWLARAEARVGRGGRFLEIGAGRGALVRVALERGWAVDATEVSQSGAEALRAIGARVHTGELTSARYDSGQFDFVATIEVLEHVATPAAFLAELARVTRSAGLALITTPNFAGLSARLLRSRWRVVDPEHVCYFTPRVLRSAVLAAGFTTVDIGTRSVDVGGWRAWLRRPATPRFDPLSSASLREAVETNRWLRLGRETANGALRMTGLGDSIVAWGRR